ncbi:hypothetical protein GF412_02285, partial [Candidatus Micrarchaeota archaeon]|nr:hypothetical protein [Candidatus Micrarchaeota archaeon]MBD3417790.1 hypothetical protein [Candidatus Micrarchaeota archaeon]
MRNIREVNNIEKVPGRELPQNTPNVKNAQPLQEEAVKETRFMRAINAIGKGAKLFASGVASTFSNIKENKATAGIAAAMALSVCV